MIHMPEWLDASLRLRGRLTPTAMSLTRSLKALPTGTVTLRPGTEIPPPGDFVRIYTPDGDWDIHRILSVTERHPGGQVTLTTQHALCTLSDDVLFGTWAFLGLDTGGDTGAVITEGVVQVEKAHIRASASFRADRLKLVREGDRLAITGASKSWYAVTSGTVKGWISKACVRNTGDPVLPLRDVALRLLGTQPDGRVYWTLGRFDVEEHAGCSFENANTLTALLTLPQVAGEDCEWRFDQSVTPWRIQLVVPGAAVGCELRLSRGVRSLTVHRTREGLCTRLYPYGQDGLDITEVNRDVPYLTAGGEDVVERILLCPAEQNAAALKRKAQYRLSRMEGPRVTVSCAMIDRYPDTGEELDHMVPGKMCRVVLPGQEPLLLRVTEVRWADLISAPGLMTVELNGPEETVVSLFNGERFGDSVIK